MTAQEWAAFAVELEHAFRGDFGPRDAADTAGAAQEATYARHLRDVDYDVATAAVALLVADGQVFLPAPGELRAAVGRLTRRAAPPFAAALVGVARLAHRHRPRTAGMGPPWTNARQEAERVADRVFVAAVGEALGEGAARWAQARGRRGLLAEVDALAGEHAGAARKRLTDEYAAFVAQADEDAKVGLALAHAERVAVGPGGLRRLSPGAAGLPRPS